ncbi:ATP-dependent RNA helicase [Trypanosoma rangeli]|uniref:ATP-dependent RNA helicase n=1 Tax=Trypanosoma rangeli TaxID=5698 RepID=A0A422P419_TRYRA|nr:ATP-dependent RNA helicase [Trypanosoma rangeli]RNF12466.1 ATP-dependent RNA helicase [Trypanosoma rangeli]|eukprot:RNF12466.1 ATP-dependent RNA helicase [Trypanosoma rangeli]
MSGSQLNVICTAWPELALDSRILEAIRCAKWKSPTPVQSACIPLALKGRDLAIQSRTGSGKTGAFVIPILQRIITEAEQMRNRRSAKNPVALILLPSVELCGQTVEVVNVLAKYVRPRIVVDNLTSRGAVTRARVASAPILVTTAALLGKHCRSGAVTAEDLASLRCVVIDEVDLVMSIAEGSLRAVQSVLPPSVQTILASATLTDGVVNIKSQLLHSPVTVTLNTGDEDETTPSEGEKIVVESRTVTRGMNAEERLQHYYLVATDECHQHTLLYALYRLGHIKGKTLIFVNEEETTYKVQSFLAQLGVEALVYDSNLPLNVRVDTLHRFQVGSVGTLVCTDGTLESVDVLQDTVLGTTGEPTLTPSRKGKNANDKNVGALQRGIDFSDVRNVILFDGIAHPTTSAFSRYTHRVGRAGRAGKSGMAITLFSRQQAQKVTRQLREYLRATHDAFEPFKQLHRQEAAKLQYRVDNVLFTITRSFTRRQRISAVAAELTRSAYLKSHITQKDDTVLQRILSRSKKTTRCDPALLDVPHYMHIEGADSAENYRKRVRARTSSRSSSAPQQARTKSRDPLSRVASAVKMGVAKKRRL